jgi:2',3'-cyclic-nucleotide 2'-phosphodiesterase/3'-nucleotidase
VHLRTKERVDVVVLAMHMGIAELIDEKIPGYNFDIAEGVSYALDLRKPFGERIVDLTFKGQPLDPAKKLRVATNNYRLNGGGGYVMFKDCPVVVRSSTEIRDLIIDWVERNGAIPAEPRGIGGSCRRERKAAG